MTGGALTWVGVAALGAAGACGRFLLDGAISARLSGRFPTGTLAVNATGALVLGLLSTALPAGGHAQLLAGTALIGSYTTFSTWMLETQRLSEDGLLRHAAANVALSLMLGLAGAALGRALGGVL